MSINKQLAGPLAIQQLHNVTEAIKDFSPEQKIWLSGYLAGQALVAPASAATQSNSQEQLTVLYGSQTGNAKLLAQEYVEQATSMGLNAHVVSLADYKARKISKEKNIVLIVSTHGEGDAPDDAEIFYEYIFSDNAPQLKQLNYSVLALGDSSYEQFCQTGVDIDQQFKKLGATAVVERVDCDLDFEDDAKNWQEQTLKHYKETLAVKDSNVTPLSLLKSDVSTSYNRNNTYASEVLAIQRLTTTDSVKNVYHIELSIEDSGITYEAGDSLGVVAHNNEHSVKAIIDAITADPNEQVSYKGNSYKLVELLTSTVEITLLNKSFLKFYAEHAQAGELKEVIATQQAFNDFVVTRQLIDVLKEYQSPITAQQLVENLMKITPRLYSIASSFNSHPDEVHLTISLVESSQSLPNHGLVSGLLCSESQVGDKVNIYIESNNNFKAPEQESTDMIMIGAGTGIAPYRAFLQDRFEKKASGKNWLFFGNPSYENDFLYQLELQKLYKQNVLNEIDLAFSRDQEEKIYVQHRVKQKGQQIWQWIENGAHLYICGNADYMAKDVEKELLALIAKHGQKSAEEAKDYLSQLKRNNRYQKDVY